MRGRSRLEKGDIQPPEKLDILPTGIIFIRIGKGCRSIQYARKYLFFLLCAVVRHKPLASFLCNLCHIVNCDTHFLYMTFYYILMKPFPLAAIGGLCINLLQVTRFLFCMWLQLISSDMVSLLCLHPSHPSLASLGLHPSSQ